MSRSATAIILSAELRAWRHRLLKRSALRLALLAGPGNYVATFSEASPGVRPYQVFDIFGWIRILLLVPLEVRAEWMRSLSLALALAFSSTFFFIAYRYFPHRKIPAGAALAGALLAAVLFESAKQLFRWYILRMGVYDRIYGPLGALVGIAMFSYYTGVVFILGAEFVAALTIRQSRA